MAVRAGAFALGLAIAGNSAHAQRVVVSHDEWFTGGGFFNSNEQRFVSNALTWFGLTGSGNILLYSSNGFLVNTPFENYLGSLGYAVTVNSAPATFAGYSAVFSESVTNLNGSGLAAYALGGGNVFYIGGTGVGGAAGEAAYSNTFLNAVGLSFAPAYNGLGTVNTSGFSAQGPFGPALFTGVASVFSNSGNDISAPGAAGWTTQVFSDQSGNGVYAAAAITTTATPEPASRALLATGLLALVAMVRMRRRV